ncbi:LysM peptidoglycan-binding domain-containing protein [Pontibacter silvestris]|uniref:LysM peptidoglycan-binding domain-containing protein n=1 Tax=Pontibacter silvestris TaxID=2305183 RepID=A0ABW4X431_9BACT|nr:LysM peptidoglycan-binding domain-containing protein [Pontibacter silvestris]MCC9137944.1 LysM peptidoglycan-binding domain-containing protein [Pontibacter silvestris]
MMRKQLPLLLLLLLPLLTLAQSVVVPNSINFADIQVKISNKGQQEIQKKVDALHRHPVYFQAKVNLADMYFPLIERTLKEEGVPDDFKYLALQESGLVSDAVSSSNAVGFWQFKKEAASDFNLRIDNQVDERRHIIEASRGAAKYLKRSNNYYNNWLNTLLSYNLGLTGAKSYSKASDNGSRRMEVTDKTHPYVLTFLAHKIAYEEFIGKSQNPPVSLREMRAKPGQSLSEIARATKADPAEVERYNKWLLGNKIPSDKDYYVMIPLINGDDRGLLAANTTATDNTTAASPNIFRGFGRSTKHITAAVVKRNGLNTIIADKGDTHDKLAEKAGLTTKKFLRFNDMYSFDKVEEGTAYYIERKKARADKDYHVVQAGETMQQISQHYGVQLRYLLYKNRMKRNEAPAPGRVLWLQKRRPKNEPIEVVREQKGQLTASTTTTTQSSVPKENPFAKLSDSLKKDTSKQDTSTSVATTQTQEDKPKENIFKRFINSFKRFKKETEEDEYIAGNQEEVQDKEAMSVSETTSAEQVSTQAPAAKESTVNPVLYPGKKAEATTESIKTTEPVKEESFEVAVETDEAFETEEQASSENATETTVTAQPFTSAANAKSAKHVVKQGETLYSISRMYAVSLNDITKWNNLGDTPIKIGQELIIAEPLITPSETGKSEVKEPVTTAPTKATTSLHTVVTGETLYQVSKQYNISLDDLRQWNNLPDNSIKVGQELRVAAPAENIATPAQEAEAPVSSTSANVNQSSYHTVAAGESMYQISRNYGVTIKDIMEWNNKSDFSVSIGEKLLIKKK